MGIWRQDPKRQGYRAFSNKKPPRTGPRRLLFYRQGPAWLIPCSRDYSSLMPLELPLLREFPELLLLPRLFEPREPLWLRLLLRLLPERELERLLPEREELFFIRILGCPSLGWNAGHGSPSGAMPEPDGNQLRTAERMGALPSSFAPPAVPAASGFTSSATAVSNLSAAPSSSSVSW